MVKDRTPASSAAAPTGGRWVGGDLGVGNAEPMPFLTWGCSKLRFVGFPLGGSVVLRACSLRKAVVHGVYCS